MEGGEVGSGGFEVGIGGATPQLPPTLLHSFSVEEQLGGEATFVHLLFVQMLHGSAIAAFWLKSCCCWVSTNPAPTPPTRSRIPKIVAIILPPPNFFFGDPEITGGKLGGAVSVGAADPFEPPAGGTS